MTRPPVFVRLMLAVIRGVSLVVPRRDRTAWRHEWEAEIVHATSRSNATAALPGVTA